MHVGIGPMNGIFTYIWRSLLRLGSVNFAKDDDPTFRVAGWGRMAILIDGFAWDAWDERYIYRSMNG